MKTLVLTVRIGFKQGVHHGHMCLRIIINEGWKLAL